MVTLKASSTPSVWSDWTTWLIFSRLCGDCMMVLKMSSTAGGLDHVPDGPEGHRGPEGRARSHNRGTESISTSGMYDVDERWYKETM